jgi:hypothetical protein
MRFNLQTPPANIEMRHTEVILFVEGKILKRSELEINENVWKHEL